MTEALRQFNALTIDVEDYFQVSAFTKLVPYAAWDRQPSRVVQNTKKVLELLAEFDLRGTFFVLGWVAKRYSSLVRQIQEAGHDLGCHSYAHPLIYCLSPKEFRDDTRRATAAIEDASGAAVHAYRAPSFSITEIKPSGGFAYRHECREANWMYSTRAWYWLKTRGTGMLSEVVPRVRGASTFSMHSRRVSASLRHGMTMDNSTGRVSGSRVAFAVAPFGILSTPMLAWPPR